MGLSQFFHCLRRSAMVTLIGMTCACQPSDTGDAPTSSKAPQTAVPVTMDAPTLAELENATYLGIDEEPVTLVDGEWQGEPFIEGGASRPRAGLVRDFHLSGNLNGDGVKESVALLWTNAGGSGTFDYIAVVGRDDNATPINLATADLGDRVNVRAAAIDDGRIVVNVVQAGPDDPACCPGQKMKRTFALEGDVLNEVASEDLGRQSIADLAGVDWVLTHFNPDDEVPDAIEVTLRFDGDRIGGKSGCNQYSGGVTEGKIPGALTVNGPMTGTMMACPPPADEIERRYLDTLQAVTQYSFLTGNLALTWRKDDRLGTMIFTPHEPSE